MPTGFAGACRVAPPLRAKKFHSQRRRRREDPWKPPSLLRGTRRRIRYVKRSPGFFGTVAPDPALRLFSAPPLLRNGNRQTLPIASRLSLYAGPDQFISSASPVYFDRCRSKSSSRREDTVGIGQANSESRGRPRQQVFSRGSSSALMLAAPARLRRRPWQGLRRTPPLATPCPPPFLSRSRLPYFARSVPKPRLIATLGIQYSPPHPRRCFRLEECRTPVTAKVLLPQTLLTSPPLQYLIFDLNQQIRMRLHDSLQASFGRTTHKALKESHKENILEDDGHASSIHLRQ